MGMRMPETCWAVFKRQAINLKSWCIWLVDSVESMIMHGLANPKFNIRDTNPPSLPAKSQASLLHHLPYHDRIQHVLPTKPIAVYNRKISAPTHTFLVPSVHQPTRQWNKRQGQPALLCVQMFIPAEKFTVDRLTGGYTILLLLMSFTL
jgi:hypothetical protein